jgi:spore coat protein U-like protein
MIKVLLAAIVLSFAAVMPSFGPGMVTDGKPRAYTICAQVGAGQSPPAGPYTDSVLVTVNF